MKQFSIVLLTILMFSLNFAATFYVSPTGDDGWDGSFEHPWETPGWGSKEMSGGDTLIIFSGDYVMELFWDDMITPPSGSPGAPTVIIGQGDTKPRMLGTGSLFSCVAMERNGCHVILKNLELTSLIDEPYTGGCRGGIDASTDSSELVHDLLFEDIEIHRIEDMALNLGGDVENITIKRCNIHHCAYTCIGGPTAYGDGWVNVVIDSCYLGYAGHFNHGIDTVDWEWDRPDGVGFEESEGPIIIRYTVADHNMGDGLDSKSKRTYIHHCVVSNNYGDGIKLWGDSSFVSNTLVYGTGGGYDHSTPWCLLIIDTDDPNAYFEVINNTFWDSPERSPHYTATIQHDESTNPITLLFQNNIISGLRMFYNAPIVNLIAENNLFFIDDVGYDIQIAAGGIEYTNTNIGELGTGNIYGDPLFIDPQWDIDGDFHLQDTSPARDAGTTVSLTDDLDFFPRPYNTIYDIGCYEWHESTSVSEKTIETNSVKFHAFYSHSRGVVLRSTCRGEYAIFDISGKVYSSGILNGEKIQNFPAPSGIYFARFVTPYIVKNVKFLVIW